MQRVDLKDFTGGISEQLSPESFSERQWSKLKGFVLDTDMTTRSQWPGQRIGSIAAGVKAVSGFSGSSNSYLVAIDNDGFIHTATAPSDTANYTTTNGVTWTKQTSIAANTDYRFICEMLLPLPTLGEVNALLIHSVSGTTPALAIYENDVTSSLAIKTWDRFYPVDQPNLIDPLLGETKSTASALSFTVPTTFTALTTFTAATAPWTIANDGDFPMEVRIGTGDVLVTLAPKDSYTHSAVYGGTAIQARGVGGNTFGRIGVLLGSYPSERRNLMPRANTGTMWRNRLLLGDINSRRDPQKPWESVFTISNKALTSNVATLTTSQNHSYLVNDVVTVTGVDSTFNGTYTITAVTNNTFSYAKTASDVTSAASSGTVSCISAINYQRNVTNKALTTNVATLTVGTHVFQVGDSVVVTGVDATFNGTYTLTVVTATTISYAKTATDVPSASATGSVVRAGTNNISRAPYAFFYSEVQPDSFREQAILFAGSGESQILGMHVLDDYLITIASPATESDGLRLFKGVLDYLSLQSGESVLRINVLRGGVGPKRDLTTSGNRVASCVWPEVGVVVFLDHLGGVWYTDGIEVDRLDRTGPLNPDSTATTDEVSALGRYLFMWRDSRLLVLSLLEGERGATATAAWTELVLPTGYTPKSFAPVAGSMYFVTNSQVWRFAMSRNNSADTERGAFDNTQLDLTVATPTMADTDQHRKVNWFRFGFRSRGRTGTSQVRTVTVKAGPALDTSVYSYSKTLNRTLADRDEFVLPGGIGSAVEASAEVTFRGDVQLESATFYVTGGKLSRPSDGSDA